MDRKEFDKIMKPVVEQPKATPQTGLISIREHIAAGGKQRVPKGYRP